MYDGTNEIERDARKFLSQVLVPGLELFRLFFEQTVDVAQIQAQLQCVNRISTTLPEDSLVIISTLEQPFQSYASQNTYSIGMAQQLTELWNITLLSVHELETLSHNAYQRSSQDLVLLANLTTFLNNSVMKANISLVTQLLLNGNLGTLSAPSLTLLQQTIHELTLHSFPLIMLTNLTRILGQQLPDLLHYVYLLGLFSSSSTSLTWIPLASASNDWAFSGVGINGQSPFLSLNSSQLLELQNAWQRVVNVTQIFGCITGLISKLTVVNESIVSIPDSVMNVLTETLQTQLNESLGNITALSQLDLSIQTSLTTLATFNATFWAFLTNVTAEIQHGFPSLESLQSSAQQLTLLVSTAPKLGWNKELCIESRCIMYRPPG